MATSGNNTYLPPDLLAELEPIASSEGISVDEVAARELRERLRDRSWQATLERGREYGRVSGITLFLLQRLIESGTVVFDLNPVLLAWLPTALLATVVFLLLARAR